MIDLDVGDVLAGKYEIKKVLGAGGMGKVYRARQVDLGRDVALKVPSAQVLASPDIMARFSREAKTVAKLMHDNVVQVYEYFHEGDVAFIAMEFVEGDDLKNLVTSSPKDVTVGDMATILERACEGLHHAHEYGIVHRDIKPHNIMVARLPRQRWRVKVMDFGIAHIDSNAQFTEMDGGQLTQTGQALGTPSYMAPEQIRGTGVSHLSDIYSFGCVIYFCFTQQTVFSGSGLTVAVAHLNEQPPSIRSIIPTISNEFDQLILRCLEKDSAKRPQDAQELGQLIKHALAPMRDTPMEQIWRETRQASNATIPIISSPTTPSAAGGPSHKFEEVKTSGRLGQTGLTGSEAGKAAVSESPTMPGAPIRETASPHQSSETIAGKGIIEAPKAATTAAPVITPVAPAKSKAPLVIAGVAAVCLIAGVGGVALLKGGSKNNNNGGTNGTGPTPTAAPTHIAAGTATPSPTDNVEATPTPKGTDIAIAITPRPTPDARPTPEPTPTATPEATKSPEEEQLLREQQNFRNTRDFATRAAICSRILKLRDVVDDRVRGEVLKVARDLMFLTAKEPAMSELPSGSFTMGGDGQANEQPTHNVTIDPFSMGKYEVSALEFCAFLNDPATKDLHLYSPDAKTTITYDEALKMYLPREGKHLHPANKVSWPAADQYAAWLAAKTGQRFRLPTEAEWEYAARSGTANPFPWGDAPPSPDKARFASSEPDFVTSHESSSTMASGICNMSGNVYEWCSDWYDRSYYTKSPSLNPPGPETGNERVIRGGSYLSKVGELTTSGRYSMNPEKPEPDVGFRLAKSLK